MSKTEQQILSDVQQVNDKGFLCGLGVCPADALYLDKSSRFIRRLVDCGKLVYVEWTPQHGAGWSTAESAVKFRI